jgi:hypothetical protein
MTTELHHRPRRSPPAAAARGLRWLLPALAALLLSACAGTGGSRDAAGGAGTMADLEQRALQRWQWLIERKPEQAYAYLTPGYRSTRTLAEYQGAPQNPAVRWTGISWHQAECEQPDSCQVALMLDYQMAAPGAGNIPGIQQLTERWLRIDGTWFHLPAD